MAGKKTQAQLTPEEKLQQALVPEAEQPYKVPANWCWTRQNVACYLSDIEKIVNGEHPYLEAKFLRGLKKPKIVSAGKFINKSSKVILVDGENSGEVFDIFVDGYMGSTFRLLCFSEIVYEQYCRYFIITNKEIYSKSKKGSAIPHLNKELFFNMPFPLPPLTEQQRIVERIESLFAKLDEAKENLQNVLDGFETRKAAILHKAFTGELTANWRKQHSVSMDSWEEKRLGKVCKINPSKINTKNLSDDLEVSFFPMASLSEITGEIVGPEIRTLGKVKNGFTNFSEGDVVFAKITPCMENGKSAIIGKLINDIGYGTTEFYVLRCGEELSNKYLHHIVRSKKFRDEAKQNMTGAVGQQRVPKKYMEDYMLNLPTFSEQTEIVRIIDDLLAKEQQAKELAENALAKIDLIKKSILARAFRGELGTNNLADEPAVELLKRVL